MDYNEFKIDWDAKSANVEADISYNKNLDEHFVTVQLFILKLKELMLVAEMMEEQLNHWQLLGFEIYDLQQKLLNKLPDFAANQRKQFKALSRGTIKEEMLYNAH